MDRRFDTYRRDMDSLHYTPGQKARLASVAAAAAEQEQRHAERTRKPFRRTVLVTAVIVAALVCTAGATGVLKSVAEIFAPYFGDSSSQQKIINEIGQPIGVSTTDNGVTITADAIIGDQYNACIAYTISWDGSASVQLPENYIQTTPDIRQPLPKTFLLFERESCTFDWESGWSGSSWFSDDDPKDNEIQFYQTICGTDELKLGTVTSTFENLQYCHVSDDRKQTFYPIVDGQWKLCFDANYADSSIIFDEKQSFQTDDMSIAINYVSVSPIGFYIEMSIDREIIQPYDETPEGQKLEKQMDEKVRHLEEIPVILTKTDGTTIDLTETDFSISSADGKTLTDKYDIFHEIIPLNEMECITIGDVSYDIPHN